MRINTPTAVEITDKTVQVVDGQVVVRWSTEGGQSAYSYTDATALPGAYYRYVIELVDTNGLSSYSEVGPVGGLRKLYLPT